MSIVVQKYGGSSLADTEKIKNVAKRILDTKNKGNKVVAIVSAMGDTTDELIQLANQVNDNPPKREIDRLLSTGEQVSISLLAMAINSLGENAISLTGSQAGIMTDSVYNKAKIVNIVSDRILEELDKDNIVIVAGFQGINEGRDITTLGRGGSDTTAVSIAASLKADLCEIFTDVDGVYSCDPRIVPDAKKLSKLSYNEMLELAVLGAKVLHPRCVEIARANGVTIHVRSSFSHNIGTIVKEADSMENDGMITGIAHDFDIAKVVIFGVLDKPGSAAKVFKLLSLNNISIHMIVQSAVTGNKNDIAFTCSSDDAKEAKSILENIKDEIEADRIEITDNVAKVSVVGSGMMTHSNIASKMFDVLGESNINIDMISTSEITISVIVNSDDCKKAVKNLAKEFDLS